MPIRTVKKTSVPSLAVVGFLVNKDPTELMQEAEDLAVETYNRLDSELDACVNFEAVFRHCIEVVSYREINDFHVAFRFEVPAPRIDLDALIFHYDVVPTRGRRKSHTVKGQPKAKWESIPFSSKLGDIEVPTKARRVRTPKAKNGTSRK